ncbi:alpha/beta hydrolase [Photobacterium damselae]
MAKYIVFVHGLGGEAEATWGRFPEFLSQDDSIDYKVIQYGYTSPNPIKQFYLPAPTILSIANGLLTDLQHRCDLEKDDIILVGHSMGGLVIRRLLLRLKSKNIRHCIRKVCFFDVPHEGSGLANVGRHIARFNRHLKTLCRNASELDDLNDQWVDNDLDNAYDILSVIDANETVVSSMSSKSIFRNHLVETINEVNHSTIVKPKSENDTVVLVLKNFIKNNRSINKYRNRASITYERWLRHERKHSAEFVEDYDRQQSFQALKDVLAAEKRLVRVSGLSGLGKSRLIVEYISTTSDVSEDNLLIFDASIHVTEIQECLELALVDGAEGLVVIENCSVGLHNRISKEMDAYPSKLRVITVAFDHDPVDAAVHIKLEKLSKQAIGKLISNILPDSKPRDIERIAAFVEGYPLLALMIAERYREDGVLRGSISDDGFVDKILNVNGVLSEDRLNLLEFCSLFDIFGVQQSGNEHARFIIDFTESKQHDFDTLVTALSERLIVNRVGDFARVVPKPLAVYLASRWWRKSLDDTQKRLILEMPDTMVDSFCTQVRYLDSSEKVRNFVDGICSRFGPFGQAELLLTPKGSRLFRALVEVNPKATCEAIYNIFEEIGDSGIKTISGQVRRNLIWALEMLCFHAALFDKAAWCMFKLACFENESYSNNATGQWSQLYKWQLSGSESNFEQRLTVMRKALKLEDNKADLVVIEAIKRALSTYGGTRMVGPEYQGTKPEMKEWQPQLWQDVFDYWEALIDILIELVKKPHLQVAVKDALGHEIRGLAGISTIDMLDKAINKVVEVAGKYWPSASQSIVHALQYDNKGMDSNVRNALNRWHQILQPDDGDIREKILLMVLDPARGYEKGADGHYIDVAANEAKAFANEVTDVKNVIGCVNYILEFKEQKQSWVFGKELAITLPDEQRNSLLAAILSSLISSSTKQFQFVSGFLAGLEQIDVNEWRYVIDVFASRSELKKYYPDAIRTGKFTKEQLNVFLELYKQNELPPHSPMVFSYGGVTEHLSEIEVTQFCQSLCKISHTSAWYALDIIQMYVHIRTEANFGIIGPFLSKLVLTVSFAKNRKNNSMDGYHWLKSVEMLLDNNDEDFALAIVDFIVSQVIEHDVDISNIWDCLHPALYKAFELYSESLWPSFSQRILNIKEPRHRYRLNELLGSGKESREKTNSIFTLLPQKLVVDWCSDEDALVYVSRSLKVFEESDGKRKPSCLLVALIEKYGANKKLQDEIQANFHSRSWIGSLVPYLEKDKEALEPFINSESQSVSSWANDFIKMIEEEISAEQDKDAMEDFTRGY